MREHASTSFDFDVDLRQRACYIVMPKHHRFDSSSVNEMERSAGLVAVPAERKLLRPKLGWWDGCWCGQKAQQQSGAPRIFLVRCSPRKMSGFSSTEKSTENRMCVLRHPHSKRLSLLLVLDEEE